MARRFGIRKEEARRVIHNIKDREGLRGDDNLIIYDNGDVEDEHGELLGNFCDEPGINCYDPEG